MCSGPQEKEIADNLGGGHVFTHLLPLAGPRGQGPRRGNNQKFGEGTRAGTPRTLGIWQQENEGTSEKLLSL